LRIFALLSDRDVNEYKRIEKLIEWFFVNSEFGIRKAELTNVLVEQIIAAFTGFVNPKKDYEADDEDNSEFRFPNSEFENQFDYDFDAEEIYASFIAEYGIDLVEVEFLHWYKFKILLGSLSPDSAFKRKIELRFMDLSGLKGQALTNAIKAKQAVQLPIEYSEAELREQAEFDDLWGEVGI